MPDLSALLGPLQGLLGFFQNERHYKEEKETKNEAKRQEALQAMYLALTTTHRYLEAQPMGVDRDRQLELSNLWATAAIKSRVYLSNAKHRMPEPWMLEKAQYWLDKIKWPEQKVRDIGIDLATVEQRIRELIAQGVDG